MRAYLVAGLGYGDEGKGATVDYLAHKYAADLVVRYNGGSQAGHNVVTPDGRHHTFQQFGAGMFRPGCRTQLSRFMLVNPMNMMREEEHLREVGVTDAWQRTSVDPRSLIVTPFARELNRLMAAPGTNSCGHGVGVCREMHLKHGDHVLFAGDLLDKDKAYKKLRFIQLKCLEHGLPAGIKPDSILRDENAVDVCWDWYRDWRELVTFRETKDVLAVADTVVFEGAQGVLLDETHGEPEFNTWTDTTFNNANTLLDEAGYAGKRIRVGVTRTYHTRHGAGPFPTEDPVLLDIPEPHNENTGYQGTFRRGHFDENLFRKALDICGGIDWLALNHIDQFELSPQGWYEWHNIFGYGPTYKDRKEST